jgi:hypothetical protein
MAKGGTTQTETTLPKFQETAIQQGMKQASDVATYMDTPMPLYGPQIASFSPMEQASFQGTDVMAGAFGMPSTMGQQYMPQAQSYEGGLQGYSARPTVDQMMQQFQYERPEQAEYRASFGLDPVTGEVGSRALENQPVNLEMQGGGSRGK